MITPRLFRRSLTGAFQWRLLLLWWASLLLPGAIAALPVLRFLQRHLDHSTRALDGSTLMELVRQLGEDGAAASIGLGFTGGVLALIFVSGGLGAAAIATSSSYLGLVERVTIGAFIQWVFVIALKLSVPSAATYLSGAQPGVSPAR